MDAAALLLIGFSDLHETLRSELQPAGAEELFRQPKPGLNTVGFLLWHLARDEDYMIAHTLGDAGEVWVREQWGSRMGIDELAQGTGFDAEVVAELRYEPGLLWEYAAAVWGETGRRIGAMDAETLEAPQAWSENWTLANALTTGCLAHGWMHLGEDPAASWAVGLEGGRVSPATRLRESRVTNHPRPAFTAEKLSISSSSIGARSCPFELIARDICTRSNP